MYAIRSYYAKKQNVDIKINGQRAKMTNGKITVQLDEFGWLTFYNQKGEVLLEESWRVKDGGDKTSALELAGREFKPIMGGDYRVTLRFESNDVITSYSIHYTKLYDYTFNTKKSFKK